jgi:hypothetical protein
MHASHHLLAGTLAFGVSVLQLLSAALLQIISTPGSYDLPVVQYCFPSLFGSISKFERGGVGLQEGLWEGEGGIQNVKNAASVKEESEMARGNSGVRVQ